MNKKGISISVFFFLFALSGFSGLIYESIWTHYLKLFLGHAAYAQTLVLAIFMGGMAIGSWVCSSYSLRWRNLFLGYALAEGMVGLIALVFHSAFVVLLDISYESIIPQMGSPATVDALKWGLSALMILPQSILLGMTFPLMSSAIVRRFPQQPGRSIAILYFANSIGAAIGVLASGFLFVNLFGLPGTIRIAGGINILLALFVWGLVRRSPEERDAAEPHTTGLPQRGVAWHSFFLLASLVTGAASFIYEIGWIRMLSLVLGTSTHAFELMLCAFILGLAFGGLWIQRPIDALAAPSRFLGQVQVIMGLLALCTLVSYGTTFDVMQWLVKNIAKTDAGYGLFHLSRSAVAMAVMLPATFCAGMTLPLITLILMKQGRGESSIGAVYAANTIGAILGVFFAIHIGMPGLGLKGLIIFGAGLDITLGIALFWHERRNYGSRRQVAVAAGACMAILGTILFVDLDPHKMGSGVYRGGTILTPATDRVMYHRDGKTATVTCFLSHDGVLSIRTNGKTDAAVMVRPGAQPTPDESTMILLAVLPMFYHPQAERAAAIGFGCGYTSRMLLANPALGAVDTIEIERKMVEGAQNFSPLVDVVLTDRRSKIYFDDARTFFSRYNKRYDIIVSEPSNPWVSGVAGLFSGEFYRHIQRHLHDDGLFVQWIQLYEINEDLVVSVLKAVSSSFSDFAVYATNGGDMVILAVKSGLLREPDYSLLNVPGINEALRRIHIEGEQDIVIRKMGSKKFLGTFLASSPIRANSDYYPVLDQNAAQARFLEESARELVGFSHIPIPTLEMLDRSSVRREATNVTPSPFLETAQETSAAMGLRDYFRTGRFGSRNVRDDLKQNAELLRKSCRGTAAMDPDGRLGSAFTLSVAMIPYLSSAELAPFWHTLETGACSTDRDSFEWQWYALFKAVGRRDGQGMLQGARTLLASRNYLILPERKYLLAAGMVGALAQGEQAAARELWDRYRTAAFGEGSPDLLFRLLAAESGDR